MSPTPIAFIASYFAAAIVAQGGTPELTLSNGLFVYGPMGLVLAWFMLRGEAVVKEIRSLGHRIDGLTKAMLVDVLSRENAGTSTRATAKEMLDKIEDRDRRERNKGKGEE